MRHPVLPAAAALAALLLSATNARAQVVAGPTQIYPGDTEFETIFDASGGQTTFPLPAAPRSFAGEAELVDFMALELNAEALFDPTTGELLGFRGSATMYGEPCVLDATATSCAPIESAVVAFLGGASGYFLYQGVPICVDEAKCGEAAPALRRSMAFFAESSGGYDIVGTSFATGYHFREVGTQTKQGAGGYNPDGRTCLLPWGGWCWGSTGWNSLKTESFLTDAAGDVARAMGPKWCGDCRKVRQFDWGLSIRTPPETPPWTYHGAYGWHWGEGPQGDKSDASCVYTGCIHGP